MQRRHKNKARSGHLSLACLSSMCSQRVLLQWKLSIKDTLNRGHLANEDTVCCPNHIELCTNLPLN